MTYCRFGVARVQLQIISEVCLKQILQTLSPSESPLMKCSHTAPNIVPAKIMKYDASTLFGLQAPLTLIRLCSTSKGSISVILWCPQPLKSSQFSGERKEWFIKKASNFPPAIHLQKFTLRDTFFWIGRHVVFGFLFVLQGREINNHWPLIFFWVAIRCTFSTLLYLTSLQTHSWRIDALSEKSKGNFTGAWIPELLLENSR